MSAVRAALVLALLSAAPGEPAAAGDLALDPAAIDAVFAEYDRDDGPGCSLGIVHDGELVYARGYGMASLEHGVPNGPRSVFRIGSTSKQLTAACVVLAAQEGKLSLEDDVRAHVPELPEYGEPITLRHLLNHTSGIRDYLGLMSLAGLRPDDYVDDEEVLALIARQRELNFAPGERELYSNSGYFLLSVVIARATGEPLDEFARTRIFEPLGMQDTHFHVSHRRIVPRRSEGYSPAAGGGWEIHRTTLPMIGDGGVFTTVEDLLSWDRNFYEPKVGGQALVDALQEHGRLDDGRELTYALGLNVHTYRGLPVVSHGGAFVGYRAELVRFPEERVSIVCLGNTSAIDPTSLCYRVADLVLRDRFPASPGPGATPAAASAEPPPAAREAADVDPDVVARYAGEYLGDADGARFAIRAEGSALVVESGANRMRLVPVSETEFLSVDARPGRLAFARDAEDAPWHARLDAGRGAQRLSPYLPWDASFMALDDYAGTYRSDELGVLWSLAPAPGGDGVEVRIGGRPTDEVVPLGLDHLRGELGHLVFERDPFQAVSGFRLQAGRVQNLRFRRVE